jgi:hypothetical protein
MDEPNDLVRGMLALEVTAVMLVAGELYLVTRPVALANVRFETDKRRTPDLRRLDGTSKWPQ